MGANNYFRIVTYWQHPHTSGRSYHCFRRPQVCAPTCHEGYQAGAQTRLEVERRGLRADSPQVRMHKYAELIFTCERVCPCVCLSPCLFVCKTSQQEQAKCAPLMSSRGCPPAKSQRLVSPLNTPHTNVTFPPSVHFLLPPVTLPFFLFLLDVCHFSSGAFVCQSPSFLGSLSQFIIST